MGRSVDGTITSGMLGMANALRTTLYLGVSGPASRATIKMAIRYLGDKPIYLINAVAWSGRLWQ